MRPVVGAGEELAFESDLVHFLGGGTGDAFRLRRITSNYNKLTIIRFTPSSLVLSKSHPYTLSDRLYFS